MTDQPSPKRQRTGDKPEEEHTAPVLSEETQKALQAVDEELEAQNEKLAAEILAIETKYNANKRPAYEKRAKLLAGIPNFWKHVLVNHPLIGNCLDENDEKLLEALTVLDVTFVDQNGGFKIELSFKDNAFFSNKTLFKQIKFSDEGEADVTASKIAWKNSAEGKELSENEDSPAFFHWFVSTDADQDLAEIIKDEVWKAPVPFFLNEEEDEEEEEEEGGEDEEEGDDAEEAEEE